MSRANFKISNEGDCERVSKVFRLWLQQDDVEAIKGGAICTVPHPMWAQYFSEIYTDEISNYDLADKAEENIIDVIFEVDGPYDVGGGINPDTGREYTSEEISDLLNDLIDDLDLEIDEDENEDDDDA